MNQAILVNFSIFFINLMFLYIFKIIIKLIMTSSRFGLGLTSKPLNLSFLWFNERSGSENLTQNKCFLFSHAFTYCCWCLVYLLALHLHSYCWTWSSFLSFFSFFFFLIFLVEKLKWTLWDFNFTMFGGKRNIKAQGFFFFFFWCQ